MFVHACVSGAGVRTQATLVGCWVFAQQEHDVAGIHSPHRGLSSLR